MTPRDLISLPYRIVRTPIAIADFKIVQRLPEDSQARLLIERTIGSVDQLAGRLLHDESLARIGTDRIANAGRSAEAADLEAQAAEKRRAAAETDRAAAQRAADERAEAQERENAAAAEAADTERTEKAAAARTARKRATSAKQHTEARANRSLSAIKQGLQQTEAVAEAREHQAEEKAKEELADAEQERSSARATRADAKNLDALAEQAKADRTDDGSA